LGRHIILLNGVPGCNSYDAAVYSPDAAWVHPENAELYSSHHFLGMREFLEKLDRAAAEPIYLVWDGVGHFDAVAEPGAFQAAGQARGAAGAAADAAGASPAGRGRARPANGAAEDPALATSPPGSAKRGGGGPCPHALFVNEPEEISAAQPAACPFGINCTIGQGKGGNCVFSTKKAFRAHGAWHMKREVTAQERAANATYVGDANDSEDDAGAGGGPVPGPPPRDAYAELRGVALDEALEPGHRTVQWIPRPLKPMALAALTAALRMFGDAEGEAPADAGKALALFAINGLGVRRADTTGDAAHEAATKSSARHRRDRLLSRQLRWLARGFFAEALENTRRRLAQDRAAPASPAQPAGAPPPPDAADADGAAGAAPDAGDLHASSAETQHPPSPEHRAAAMPALGPAPGDVAAGVAAAAAPEKAKPEPLLLAVLRRVRMFCGLGEFRKAADALTPQPRAAFNEDTFAVLTETHPPERVPIPPELLDKTGDVPVQVEAPVLAGVLRRLRRGVAPGPSLLTNDHVLTLFPVETEEDVAALAPLLAFTNKALSAEVPEETADWFASATLAALYKPDGAGGLKRREGGATDGKLDVRPIAMPETLFRITALCGLAACKKDIVAELTKHQQLSVGVSSAAEGIITAVRLYMEEVLSGGDVEEAAEPLLRALLNADASNAFNSIDRGVMLAELKAVAPGLLPLARMVYSRPGRLVLPNHGAGEEHFSEADLQ
jgi:hypothetical protein